MPKASALRKGRVSHPGLTYAITKCCHKHGTEIIVDPRNPTASERTVKVIVDSLKWMHTRGRARCYGYVIMPDHLHAIIQLGDEMSLSDTMRNFSSFTSLMINRLNGRSGRFWQAGYYDRALATNASYDRQLSYLAENPVRKGYVGVPQAWPYTEILPEW